MVAGFRRGLTFSLLEFKIFIFWLCWILVAREIRIFIVAFKIFSCSIQTFSWRRAEFSFLEVMEWNAAGDYGALREDQETAEGGFLRGLCLFRGQWEGVRE